MKILNRTELIQIACRTENKWAMEFKFENDVDFDTSLDCFGKTAQWLIPLLRLNNLDSQEIIIDNCGVLFFDTQEKMINIFNQTISEESYKVIRIMTTSDKSRLYTYMKFEDLLNDEYTILDENDIGVFARIFDNEGNILDNNQKQE